MKIVLVNPNPDSKCLETYPPMGLAYLASIAKSMNQEIDLIDAHLFSLDVEKTVNLILDKNPDLVGFYLTIGNFFTVQSICKRLRKERFKGKIVFGGPLCTIYDNLLQFSDYVVVGEGENSFKALIEHLEKKQKIKPFHQKTTFYGKIGIAFKKSGKVVFIPQSPVLDLDKIPFPDWSVFPNLRRYKSYCRERPDIPILTSRGCPYQCIYCNKSIFGFKFRARSPKNVVDEIEYLIDRFGARELSIHDDVFALDTKRAEKICDLIIERKIDIAWKCDNGIRAEDARLELLKKMKKAGCYMVAIGAESGNQDVVNKIRRNQDLDVVRKAAKNIKSLGMVLKVFFQFGLPYDTAETMKDTIEFAKELDPRIAQFAITTPLPDTELYRLIENKGKFLYNDWSSLSYYGGKAMYKIFDLNPRDVELYWKKAYREFYLRPKKIFSLLNIRNFREILYALDTFQYIFKSAFK